MIGEVEDFRAQLNGLTLGQTEAPVKPQIEVLQSIATEDVTAGVAECIDRVDLPGRLVVGSTVAASTSIGEKRARVEPPVRMGGGNLPIADDVRTIGPATGVAFIPS